MEGCRCLRSAQEGTYILVLRFLLKAWLPEWECAHQGRLWSLLLWGRHHRRGCLRGHLRRGNLSQWEHEVVVWFQETVRSWGVLSVLLLMLLLKLHVARGQLKWLPCTHHHQVVKVRVILVHGIILWHRLLMKHWRAKQVAVLMRSHGRTRGRVGIIHWGDKGAEAAPHTHSHAKLAVHLSAC